MKNTFLENLKKLFRTLHNHDCKILIMVLIAAFMFQNKDREMILETLPWLVAFNFIGCLCVGCLVYGSSLVDLWNPTSKCIECCKFLLFFLVAIVLVFGLLGVGVGEASYLNYTFISVEKVKGLYIASGLSWFVPVLFMIFVRKGKSLVKLPIFARFQKD